MTVSTVVSRRNRPSSGPPTLFRGVPPDTFIAAAAALCLGAHFLFRSNAPLLAALVFGGVPLVLKLGRNLFAGQFGSDLLAGVSIVTAAMLQQYLVAVIIVLMLSGGNSLEQYATRRAASVLNALAKRMPRIAHRKTGDRLSDISLDDIRLGDRLELLPHEICPVDGVVVSGHGKMDESYLTGEPFVMAKAPGSGVLSGAANDDTALTILVSKLPVDSRYAKIMKVMQASELSRPHIRRIADRLGAWYTPLALAVGLLGWFIGGEPVRFLAVMVIATPCPLLLAVPVAVISAMSLAAKRSIIIKNPAVLEQVDQCRTFIFDKTGTLTYGRPELTAILPEPGFDANEVLALAASLEQYSKHPLAGAIIEAAEKAGVRLQPVSLIGEKPGEGLRGIVGERPVQINGRVPVPNAVSGLQCALFIDGVCAGSFRFHDKARPEGKSFISHLRPSHDVRKVMLVSGDRESEVRHLAEIVGITDVRHGASPEEKIEIVRAEVSREKTLFVGDGINDAPAMLAATVGVAFGNKDDITSQAAGAVIMEPSLVKIDELIHIGRHMRSIALQSAVGGMALSMIGMLLAAAGQLPPVAGAVAQEVIDVAAVLNALRVTWAPKRMVDFQN
jgi:heavy metal translocating P-type ATPase